MGGMGKPGKGKPGKVSFGSHGGHSKPGASQAIRPRMPALVKREVKEGGDEDDEEDTSRMQYRGFDKSKLNASRKQQRMEARMGKKQKRAEHQ